MNKWQYRGVRGVALVYDVTDRQSFANLAYWLESINNVGKNTSLNIHMYCLKDVRSAKFKVHSCNIRYISFIKHLTDNLTAYLLKLVSGWFQLFQMYQYECPCAADF